MEYRFVDRFLLYKKNVDKVRDSSLNTYKGLLIRFLDEQKSIKNINEEIELYKSISRFDLEDIINNKINYKVSESYINLHIITIKDFFNYLFENDIIENNPFSKVKQIKNPTKKNIKEYFTVEEIRKIINQTYNKQRGERSFELNSSRSRSILSILTNAY